MENTTSPYLIKYTTLFDEAVIRIDFEKRPSEQEAKEVIESLEEEKVVDILCIEKL